MTGAWGETQTGVLALPSGRLVRGRALRDAMPDGDLPLLTVFLLAGRPPAVGWDSRWVRWPDFGTPTDPADARDALSQAWSRSGTERVEVACRGGTGRTGTALACLALLDGVPAEQVVDFVRRAYRPRAVETPAQRRYLRDFLGSGAAGSGGR